MRTRTLAMLGAVLALGACGKGGGQAGGNGAATGNAAGAGNAAAPAASASAGASDSGTIASGDVHLNPGEWETAADLTISGLGDLPPEVARAMKGLNRRITSRQCLTPEKAQRPTGDLFAGKRQGCNREGFTLAGGQVKGTMVCKDARGMTSTVTMDGQYGGDGFDVKMKVVASGEGHNMVWSSHSVGRRIGACPAGGDKED
jgi:hypothetical protein